MSLYFVLNNTFFDDGTDTLFFEPADHDALLEMPLGKGTLLHALNAKMAERMGFKQEDAEGN